MKLQSVLFLNAPFWGMAKNLWLFGVGIALFLGSSNPAQAEPILAAPLLSAVCKIAGCNQEQKTWQLDQLKQFKSIVSRERDPVTGKVLKWEGVLLSRLIEDVLKGLSPENRAQIDLVVIHGRKGEKAFIPRALATKYPILMAFQGGAFSSVVPWTSKPKILSEDLPLEKYFIADVDQIELANYHETFNPVFLKRRTDPSAMRGEKLFVQNCGSCHSPEPNSFSSKNTQNILQVMLTQAGGQAKPTYLDSHPEVKVLNLSQKDHEYIQRYIEEYLHEKPADVSYR